VSNLVICTVISWESKYSSVRLLGRFPVSIRARATESPALAAKAVSLGAYLTVDYESG